VGQASQLPWSDPLELDGFRPVDPWQSPQPSESRRHLPHLQATEATYFVTFRCRKGLFLSAQAKEIVMSTIRHWDGIRSDLDAAVVMPDHVHLIFRILGRLSLSAVLHSVKGYSARLINTLLARKGPFWLDESFDHVIRQEHEWEEKIGYIRDNPPSAGWLLMRGIINGSGSKNDRLESLSHFRTILPEPSSAQCMRRSESRHVKTPEAGGENPFSQSAQRPIDSLHPGQP
jgi:REP element-mobilizing transposase RayT